MIDMVFGVIFSPYLYVAVGLVAFVRAFMFMNNQMSSKQQLLSYFVGATAPRKNHSKLAGVYVAWGMHAAILAVVVVVLKRFIQ